METTVRAPWMTTHSTRAVVEALTAGGADVRFVGGCVRDALLRWESRDIDIGTPDEPERVLTLLERAGIESRTVPRGIAHGTVTALADGERYEITTLRRDVQTDGRHAEVAFTDDWREDAARRDFTINAMSLTPDGTLHDYFGGQADLAAGRVRFVGEPATRIAEDHLRILRFFRFFAWYGRGEPDAAALKACKDAAHTIPSLSGERVQAEMLKLLAADDPLPALRTMQDARVLAELLPEAQGTDRLINLIAIERTLNDTDPIRRLATLIVGIDDAKTVASTVAARWRLPGDVGARLASLTDLSAALNRDVSRRDQRRLLYRLGRKRYQDMQILVWSLLDEIESETAYAELQKIALEWVPPEFPIAGKDLLARGIPEGPEVGDLLRAVEDWWVEQDFAPDRTALLERLDALVAERRTT